MYIYNIYIETKVDNFDMTQHKDTQSMFIFHTNYQVGAAGGINNCSPNSYRTGHLDMANRKRSRWMKSYSVN